MAGDKPGRRQKFTPETIENILTAVSIGSTYTDAARAARINDQTLSNWQREGRDARAKFERGEKLEPGERAKLDFLEQLEQVESQCAIDMQTILYNEASRDAKYAQWWLERRRPDQFRPPPVRNELGGGNGGPMEIVIRYAKAGTDPA